jgi:hypothetical protein
LGSNYQVWTEVSRGAGILAFTFASLSARASEASDHMVVELMNQAGRVIESWEKLALVVTYQGGSHAAPARIANSPVRSNLSLVGTDFGLPRDCEELANPPARRLWRCLQGGSNGKATHQKIFPLEGRSQLVCAS